MLKWLGKRLRGATPEAPSPTDPAALVGEALAHQKSGRLEEAERYLYRALALTPESAEIQFHLGNLFRLAGRHEAALQCCLEGVRQAPNFAQGRNNLGNAYRDLGMVDPAIAEYQRAIVLDSSLPEAHFNLAGALLRVGDTRQAAECYRNSLRLKPDFAIAHLNLGYLIEEEGNVSGAIDAYSAAIAADPELVEAHVNLGMQLLLAGRFAEGWKEYEWRLRYPEYGATSTAASQWDGSALGGRTILLDGEQGFGDAIQFIRYAPLVAARGGRVVVRCAAELATLLQRTSGIAAMVARGEPTPEFDLRCPLPSLPGIFGTVLETIPADVPYIYPDADKAARWKARLAGSESGCRIGLVWASQSKHRTAGAKSMPLEAMAPLAEVSGAVFYSLQKGEAARQVEHRPAGMKILDLSEELVDFSETAAAVANLDLVISVDTAVAHLAGALGKPVWALLKFTPDWRWMLGRTDSPWYPTMRLFRQAPKDDWRATIEALTGALQKFVTAQR